MNERLNLIIMALNHISGPDKKRARLLLDAVVKEVKNIHDISYSDTIRIGIEKGLFLKSQPVGQFYDAYDHAIRAMKKCQENDIKIINVFDKNFPEVLKFRNGSYIYYYKGDLSILNNPNRVTVVGSRFPSEAGYDFAFDISKLLVNNGYTVISGLAQGSDTAAHKAAIENGGGSVAIVASNLASINPAKMRSLAVEIVEGGGLIMSEYSPLAITNASMFKTRDLIQAEISNKIFASEFDSNSGTLQTLEFAARLNKPTYTLKSLLENKNFNGYQTLKDKRIQLNVCDWNQLKEIIIKDKV